MMTETKLTLMAKLWLLPYCQSNLKRKQYRVPLKIKLKINICYHKFKTISWCNGCRHYSSTIASEGDITSGDTKLF